MKVAVYLRISEDIEGKELGVDRQRQDCLALVEQRGWEVFDIYKDNDISAMGKKQRPDYLRMLEDIQARRVGAVVAYHTDRLHRNTVELERYILVCGEDAKGIPTYTVKDGDLDLTTPGGRMIARIKGAVARERVEHMSVDISRKHEQKRKDGLSTGAGRLFGWTTVEGQKGMRQPVETEAQWVVKMYDHLLAGKSFGSMATELNAHGMRTARGNAFTFDGVRDILRSATHAGLIEHFESRKPRVNEHGVITEAQWDGIVSRETWDAAIAILTNPARSHLKSGPKHKSLLGGIMVCGACGKPVYRTIDPTMYYGKKEKPKKRPADYTCRNHHTNYRTHSADEYAVTTLLGALRESAEAQSLRKLRKDKRGIESQLKELSNAYAERRLSIDQLIWASDPLNAELKTVETAIAQAANADQNYATRHWWDALELNTQRELMQATLRLTLNKTDRRGCKSDPAELRITIGKR